MNRTSGMHVLWIFSAVLLAGSGAALSAERPSAILKEMTKAEDAYFALYNSLNTDHQYDIVCRKDRATGTTLVTRVCQPRYLLRAKEAAASERIRGAISSSDNSGAANSRGPNVGNAVADGGATSPSAEQAMKQEGFRRNMMEVLEKSPELQALGKQRDELQARYEAATQGARGR